MELQGLLHGSEFRNWDLWLENRVPRHQPMNRLSYYPREYKVNFINLSRNWYKIMAWKPNYTTSSSSSSSSSKSCTNYVGPNLHLLSFIHSSTVYHQSKPDKGEELNKVDRQRKTLDHHIHNMFNQGMKIHNGDTPNMVSEWYVRGLGCSQL